MTKKIIWLIVFILIISTAVYFKLSYPLSQMQLNKSFKSVLALPIEHYYNATENSCGIWYESKQGEQIESGRSNEKVMDCFMQAFEKCEAMNVLLVKDNSQSQENMIIYSLIRIMRPNDRNECIMQNYFQEQSMDNEIKPLSFINTCTELSEEIFDSCEPKYITDERKKQNQQAEEITQPIAEDIQNEQKQEQN